MKETIVARSVTKKLYAAVNVLILFTAVLAAMGIGGWINFTGKDMYAEDHGRRCLLLIIMTGIMFYGYKKYDATEEKLLKKVTEEQAAIIRLLQIGGIAFIALALISLG